MVIEYEERQIEINGMRFRKLKGVRYPHGFSYYKLVDYIDSNKSDEIGTYRELFQKDLFALIFFALRIPTANHPFVVNACKEVAEGPKSHTVEMYAREHYKSTLFTIAEPIQKVLNNPEERISIFSHTKAIALNFLRVIKFVLEESAILKACFPDILYGHVKDAKKWSEQDGLFVKRQSAAKEPTFSAHGLLEGMPTSAHFTHRIYDDVETADMVYSPEIIQRLIEMYDLSQNLGTLDGTHRLVGTPYHHSGLLMNVINKRGGDGLPLYTLRKKPATVDGTPNGASVFLPESRLSELKTNKQLFFSQQLCDPTPQGMQKLNYNYIKEIDPGDMPKRLYKFMTIDPAGVNQQRSQQDSWGIMVCGVEPYMDDLGASNLYILDLVCEPLSEVEAMNQIVSMYMRHGRILKLGVEKVGLSSVEVHVSNALRARGKIVTLENEGLVILRTGQRSKELRVTGSLCWPLNNGKIFISRHIPVGQRERLRLEMEKFPFWHDDALDALSYQYDLIKSYSFSKKELLDTEKKKRDVWADAFDLGDKPKNSWMYV